MVGILITIGEVTDIFAIINLKENGRLQGIIFEMI